MKTYSVYTLLLLCLLAACKKNDPTPLAAAPIVSGINPASGPKNTAVTITGNNFGSDISKVTVLFNGVPATIQSENNTQVIATVPSGAGTGNIKVTVNNLPVNGPVFTYTLSVTVTTLAGNGQQGYADGTGKAAKFNFPAGIAADSSGNIYVADQNIIIRKITSAGVVTTLAGMPSVPGNVDGTGSNARFYNIWGMTIDPQGNNLVECEPGLNAIRKVTTAVGAVTTYAHSTTQAYADGPLGTALLNAPIYIAVDAQGTIYFTEYERIRKISTAGVVSTLAGNGLSGTADGSTGATVSSPLGITTDAQGNVYFSEDNNQSIRKITPAGYVSTLAGGTTQGFADGTGSAAQFDDPMGLVADKSGNIYVADRNNNRIRKITPAGVVTTLAGAGGQGYFDGDGTTAVFNNPETITIDKQGNLYVSDLRNHAIRKITLE